MKGFAIVLAVVLAAAQVHGAAVKSTSSTGLAALGENPWVVHLRIAIATSGYLNTGVGSLISPLWVLSTASNLQNSRFVWVRYGVVDVISPELVTESSTVRIHPSYNIATGANNIALLSINRVVQLTPNIRPVDLEPTAFDLPNTARFCAFGELQPNVPGEQLACVDVGVNALSSDLILAEADDARSTRFDVGAPLVSGGVQYGALVSWSGPNDRNAGVFVRISSYLSWINAQINSAGVVEISPRIDEDVKIIN